MKKSEVQHIADLAKLRLTDLELNQLAVDMDRVLRHFEKLQSLETTGIEPLVTPFEGGHWMREDKVDATPEAARKAIMNAPEHSGHLFKVPPVV